MRTKSKREKISQVVESTLLPDQSLIEPMESDSEKTDESASVNDDETYPCNICGKCFKSRSGLYLHNRGHLGEKPFSCTVCGKSFNCSSNLLQHKKVHTGDKPFTCGQCAKSFSQKASLLRHTRTHTGERPFPCGDCEKRFITQSKLSEHRVVHTGEKTFACDVCGRCFTYSSNLAQHKRVHKRLQGFTCHDCGKSFSTLSILHQHKWSHKCKNKKSFTCDECERCFPSKALLSSHKKGHKRRANLPNLPSCSDWSKVFVDELGRLKPLELYTDKASFTCSVCGLRFIVKSMLLSHEKVHPSSPRDLTEGLSKNDDLSQQQMAVEGEETFLVNESSSSGMPHWQKVESKTILSNGDLVKEEIDPLKVEIDPSQELSVKEELNPFGDIIKEEEEFVKEEIIPFDGEFVKEPGNT